MDVAELLVQVALMLLFAKVGAELAERIGVPAVIGEIVAGLVLGPSLLDWVHLGDTVRFLAEFGVILLLVQVGMEMDLAEMRRVGSSAVAVAVAGVGLPMALGFGAATAFGESTNTALFLGAALAATSVGITARTLGDLRMLASVEARIVLGAAVVDDILGLVILTVVVRIVEEGSLDALAALELLGVAVVFLVVLTAVGVRLAPPAFRWLHRNARSSGALEVAALVLTLGFAVLAHEVELAVIIGAFVAGLALGRTRQSERIERDLSPLANFFVPIFFVSVGLEVDVTSMADGAVLALAGALLAAGVVGKLAGGVLVRQRGVDRLLVGIGMIPRGEVGLIFATIGLSTGVLDEQLYAALLVVVLVTTVATPPAIRARIHATRSRSGAATTTTEPEGGWLESLDGVVRLRARPAEQLGLAIALRAAEMAATDEADDDLVAWMVDLAGAELTWTTSARAALADLLANGNRRSWRLLDATGLLAAALVDLADEFDNRRHDTTLLDPAHLMRLPVVERLADLLGEDGDERARAEAALLSDPKALYLAALALDLAADYESPAAAARDLVTSIAASPPTAAEVETTARDAALLRRAAAHLGALSDAVTPDLVAHVGAVDRARRIYLLGLALGDLDATHRAALEELYAALVSHLGELADASHPGDPVELRRAAARELATDARVRARIATAAPVLVVTETPVDLAADLELLAAGRPLPGEHRVRVHTTGAGEHRVAVAARDTPGLFARVAQALAGQGCDLDSAVGAPFADGAVLDVFRVRAGAAPDADRLPEDILAAFADPLPAEVPPEASIAVDPEASPWFTVCTVTLADRPGALAGVAAALCAHDVSLHRVWVTTRDGIASCRFDLTDHRGRKLAPQASARLAQELQRTD
jgi:Kef-type K+ transport system membrane component KefB